MELMDFSAPTARRKGAVYGVISPLTHPSVTFFCACLCVLYSEFVLSVLRSCDFSLLIACKSTSSPIATVCVVSRTQNTASFFAFLCLL
jgi:hypothetical protein